MGGVDVVGLWDLLVVFGDSKYCAYVTRSEGWVASDAV